MKTLFAFLAAILAVASTFGQGLVSVFNTPTTPFQTNIFGAIGGVANAGTFDFEVLTAPSTVTSVDSSLQDLLTSTWSDTGIFAQNTTFPGRMSTTNQVANNWPAGSEQSFIILGWTANLGTFHDVMSELAGAYLGTEEGSYTWFGGGFDYGFLGATTVGTAFAGGGASGLPPFALFGSATNVQGTPISTPTELYHIFVPEPTVAAMAGLGAAVMLIFRRRK
jgi:hypothetical protein